MCTCFTNSPVSVSALLSHIVRPMESFSVILGKAGLDVEADIAQDLYDASQARVEKLIRAFTCCGEELHFVHDGICLRRIPCAYCKK